MLTARLALTAQRASGQRGYYGTYHPFSPKYCRYADEFSFRLNDGNVRHHTGSVLRHYAIWRSGNRITYKELTV